jgi:hypothetical protein
MTKRQLVRKLDKAWAEKVKQRGSCEYCGKRENLQAAHIIGRTNRRLRWDERNGVCLCVRCHLFGPESAHKNPLAFLRWLETYRPDDLAYVEAAQGEVAHYTEDDYERMLEGLK